MDEQTRRLSSLVATFDLGDKPLLAPPVRRSVRLAA